VDERRDPEKSTRAAARYFHDLYNMFGDWYLALAAYNTGEGNVARAVERTAYADFWELHRHGALPRQTRNYVPIILALTVIAKDPARHGIQVEEEQPLQYETVKPGHALDLRLAADAAGTDLETLKALNPQLLRGVTPEDQEFELRLPAGSGEHFSAELKGIPPERWLTWRRHAVSEGETLAGIARHYGVTAEAVREANRLERDAPLEIGTRLTIPANRPASTGLGRMVRYRVRRGDTLASIAREFDVVPSDIEKWNGLHSGRVTKGMTLKVYPGGRPEAPRARSHPNPLKGGALAPQGRAAPAATPQATTHPVRQGETLWSIARAYQTSVEALRAANKFLAERPLHAGDVLVIQAPHQGPG
jgi:membrane-bound lytic murein transglycosylase D